MIIDAHYHLEERMETVDRLLEQMNRYDISRVALIPTMQEPLPYGGMADKALGLMRRAMMGRWRRVGLFMYRSLVNSDGNFLVMNKHYPIYNKLDNESVARVMQAHPDRFFGWIGVNPQIANPIEEVEKWVGQSSWIGVKAHPFFHCYGVAMLNDVAAYCCDKGLPILIHLGADKERGDYHYLPDRYPNLKVIYAHAGLPFYRELWDYAKKKGNVFIDLSSPFLDESLRISCVKALGAQKCLYGSDGPYGYLDVDGSYDHSKILNEILRWPIPDADRERILADNFREIANI